MRRVISAVVSTAMSLCIGVSAVSAEAGRADKYLQAGQQAVDSGDWTKAEMNYSKALKELESAGVTGDQTYATALKRLAQSCRRNQKFDDAGQYLNRAISVCKTIGFGDPEVNSEFIELSKECKIVDLEKLGPGSANTLKANSAVMTLKKSGSGYACTIVLPQRFEKSLNSDKIDQMGLEKECTFNVVEEADGTVRATDIKGFKIHSVEKNMWVNLLGCTFGPANGQGQHESVISAGKMGVVKNVNSTIMPKTYEPVSGIIASIHEMGQPVEPPLAIASTPSTATSTSPATSAASSPVPTSRVETAPVVSIPSVSTPPVSTSTDSTPSVSMPASSAPAVSIPPISTPAVSTPPISAPPEVASPKPRDDDYPARSESVSPPSTTSSAGDLDKAARQAAAQAALEKAGEEKEAAERDAARAALRGGRQSRATSEKADTEAESRPAASVAEPPRSNISKPQSPEPQTTSNPNSAAAKRDDDDDDDDDDERDRAKHRAEREREREKERAEREKEKQKREAKSKHDDDDDDDDD